MGRKLSIQFLVIKTSLVYTVLVRGLKKLLLNLQKVKIQTYGEKHSMLTTGLTYQQLLEAFYTLIFIKELLSLHQELDAQS